MNKIEEYTQSTSKYELYAFLTEKIISGEIKNFSEIFTYAKNINFEKVHDHKTILRALFDIIKLTGDFLIILIKNHILNYGLSLLLKIRNTVLQAI